MRSQQLVVLVALSLTGITVRPLAANAQQYHFTVMSHVAVSERDMARAVQLEAKAHATLDAMAREYSVQPSQYISAARNLRNAANLRPDGDPVAMTNLELAGRYFYYGNDRKAALLSLRELAERAIALGEINRAAHAYLDAAFLAVQERNAEGINFVRAAERLASSTHLTDKERVAIAQRIAPAPAAEVSGRR